MNENKKFTSVKYDANSEVIWNEVNQRAEKLSEYIEVAFKNNREKSLAITKLEESIMWLGKSLRTTILENEEKEKFKKLITTDK